jgi:aspartate aminotransferase-like enzyme
MKKLRLVTPGPMMAPPETLLELAKPVYHHRTPQARAVLAEAAAGLKEVCQTRADVVILTSSGTGALEAVVANVVQPGDTVIALSAGKFGERWVQLCRAFRAKTVVVEEPYGKAIPPARVAAALKEHPNAVAVLATLCETSTAVTHDIESIGRIVADSPAVLAVDGISGVGADECRTDAWHIDFLAGGSQKALMVPPGLAFLTVSAKGRQIVESRSDAAAYYFDLKKALRAAAESDTPFTPAHTLIAALVSSLRQILLDGMEAVWSRTRHMSRAVLAAIRALGLESLAERPAAGVTAIVAPNGIAADDWAKLLERKYGVKVASGQGTLKGKIIRVGHMGYLDALDVMGIVAALEWSLRELGFAVEPGAAASAASRVFSDAYR